MTAAVYARKSTSQADVADEAKSVTRQVEAKVFIAAKGWTLDGFASRTRYPTLYLEGPLAA